MQLKLVFNHDLEYEIIGTRFTILRAESDSTRDTLNYNCNSKIVEKMQRDIVPNLGQENGTYLKSMGESPRSPALPNHW